MQITTKATGMFHVPLSDILVLVTKISLVPRPLKNFMKLIHNVLSDLQRHTTNWKQFLVDGEH